MIIRAFFLPGVVMDWPCRPFSRCVWGFVVGLATVAYLYEAREMEEGGPHMVAMCHGGKVTAFVEPLPQWARQVLAGVGEG